MNTQGRAVGRKLNVCLTLAIQGNIPYSCSGASWFCEHVSLVCTLHMLSKQKDINPKTSKCEVTNLVQETAVL